MSSLPWPSFQPWLTDGALALRPWNDADADAVHTACQDPGIQRWTTIPVPYLPEHASEFVREVAPQQWESRQGAAFAIVSSEDGRLLGSCGLVRIDATNLVGEVGYWIAAWARGRKVSQGAASLLCRWAVTEGGLARLEFYIEPENAASRAVAERLGCEFEGVLRSKALLHGVRRDLALYAYLP